MFERLQQIVGMYAIWVAAEIVVNVKCHAEDLCL